MREPFFNDISITPLCITDEEINARINEFVDILEFCGFLGFKKVRFDRPASEIELKQGYYVKDYLSEHAKGNGNKALLLLNMLKPPYIDDDTVAEERYVHHTARLLRDDIEVEAEGLASALFSDSFAVGFASEEYWRTNTSFTLTITNDATKKVHKKRVFCISYATHFSDMAFIKWAINTLSLQFRPTNLTMASKTVKLRDDHGNKELRKFSETIKKETYIIEVVNSLPFDPNVRKMTQIVGDGLINVRLLNTDKKIGVVVRTTARTVLEATYIAADIEKKYA